MREVAIDKAAHVFACSCSPDERSDIRVLLVVIPGIASLTRATHR